MRTTFADFFREYLEERSMMTYDQLFSLSDPKRVARASTQVRGPALDVYSDNTGTYSVFNFKSYPSTTGLRHHGYIKFEKPWKKSGTAAEHIPVEVDCDCEDFRYVWAWADKQRGASKVGAGSLNQALNKAPKIKNKSNKPGLCKHLLAAKRYIYGMVDNMPAPTEDELQSGENETSWKLDQLAKNAKTRTINYKGEVEKAKERQLKYALANQTRNVKGPMAASATPKSKVVQVEPQYTDADDAYVMSNSSPVPLPPTDEIPTPEVAHTAGEKSTLDAKRKMYTSTEEDDTDNQNPNQPKTQTESVVVKTNNSMKIDLSKAQAIVEELEAEATTALDAQPQPLADETTLNPESPETGEAPEDEALQLLRDIRDGIVKIAATEEEEELVDDEIIDDEDEDEITAEADEIPPVDDDEYAKSGATMPVENGD